MVIIITHEHTTEHLDLVVLRHAESERPVKSFDYNYGKLLFEYIKKYCDECNYFVARMECRVTNHKCDCLYKEEPKDDDSCASVR